MFDTNAVLSIAFAITADFTTLVQAPPEAAPQRTNDLKIGQVVTPLHNINL